MSGSKVVVDSNVIILGSKKLIDIGLVYSEYEEFFASIISYLEVYSFDFKDPREKTAIEDLFDGVQIVDVDRSISSEIIAVRKQKIKKIKLPDAIILATAKHLGAELLTNNVSDFIGIDSSVIVRGIDDFTPVSDDGEHSE